MHLFDFQINVRRWVFAAFGSHVADHKPERAHRFLEEALELFQACELPQEDAHKLVNYVYARPVGELEQEVGGTLTTLAALCGAYGIDMDSAASIEHERCWSNVGKIRAKQKAKPVLHGGFDD